MQALVDDARAVVMKSVRSDDPCMHFLIPDLLMFRGASADDPDQYATVPRVETELNSRTTYYRVGYLEFAQRALALIEVIRHHLRPEHVDPNDGNFLNAMEGVWKLQCEGLGRTGGLLKNIHSFAWHVAGMKFVSDTLGWLRALPLVSKDFHAAFHGTLTRSDFSFRLARAFLESTLAPTRPQLQCAWEGGTHMRGGYYDRRGRVAKPLSQECHWDRCAHGGGLPRWLEAHADAHRGEALVPLPDTPEGALARQSIPPTSVRTPNCAQRNQAGRACLRMLPRESVDPKSAARDDQQEVFERRSLGSASLLARSWLNTTLDPSGHMAVAVYTSDLPSRQSLNWWLDELHGDASAAQRALDGSNSPPSAHFPYVCQLLHLYMHYNLTNANTSSEHMVDDLSMKKTSVSQATSAMLRGVVRLAKKRAIDSHRRQSPLPSDIPPLVRDAVSPVGRGHVHHDAFTRIHADPGYNNSAHPLARILDDGTSTHRHRNERTAHAAF